MAAVEPGTRVTAHYQWVRQLSCGRSRQDASSTRSSIRSPRFRSRSTRSGQDVAGGVRFEILSNPSFRVLLQTLRQQAAALPPAVGTDRLGDRRRAGGATSSGARQARLKRCTRSGSFPMCTSLIANRYPFASAQSDVQLADFGTVFGYDGLFDKFFTDYLEKQVDTTGSVWTWRPGSVNPSHGLLEQMQQARHIRDMFFNPGSKMPEVKFFVTFTDLDPACAARSCCTIDGSERGRQGGRSRRSRGRVRRRACDSRAFDARYFDPPSRYGGPWAWFRMVDATRIGYSGCAAADRAEHRRTAITACE